MASADVSIFGNPLSHDPSAPDATTGANAPRDDLDDLFNYNATADSIFGDVPAREPTAQPISRPRDTFGATDNLGIDEEVKTRKPRAPIAKLDEARLLSANGIPKLQKITKTRLKFRGKGHEFSDVERMLNTYQLWLDDLFPKAKFMDGLALIEKLGHKKGMQVHRRGWIEEGKPKLDREGSLDGFVDADDDDMDMTYGEVQANEDVESPRLETRPANADKDQPEGDELDMLLAEDAARQLPFDPVALAAIQSRNQTPADDYQDDMDALRELNNPW